MVGDDTICGGDGADRIFGDDAFDEVEPGDDLIHGEDATDELYGGGGNDAIYGGNNHPNNPVHESCRAAMVSTASTARNGADTLTCGTDAPGSQDAGDLGNGGTAMPGNAQEADRNLLGDCPLASTSSPYEFVSIHNRRRTEQVLAAVEQFVTQRCSDQARMVARKR